MTCGHRATALFNTSLRSGMRKAVMARFYHGIGVQYSVSYGPFLTLFLFYGSFCFTF
nr:hypothetical protein KXZ65_22270 [Pectobacterium sp. PL152]WED68606.1 hypothetical protein PJ912_23685 [Pectobacterium colocasium]